MSFRQSLHLAWARYWVLSRHRPEPVWARIAISTLMGLAFALVFGLISVVLNGALLQPALMAKVMGANLIISLSISYTIHLMFRTAELSLPPAWIARIASWRDWRAGLVFSSIGIGGSVLGFSLGLWLLGRLTQTDVLNRVANSPDDLRVFGVITVLITLGNWIWWHHHGKQQALQLRATEAQLRLLQGQIEPHFLFNTLANVQSLMDYDTPRAKQMLESFTDYLRASLGQLRAGDSTLEAELAMAQSYLQLMQARMGERLSYVIEADAQARAAVLPPLLLQPLIENAIHHGLEPKVEGGQVHIKATVSGLNLELCVSDNGLGIAPARAKRRPGNGLALKNLRERLVALYQGNARFELSSPAPADTDAGTLARLTLPYITQS